jgi:hypothetical protein
MEAEDMTSQTQADKPSGCVLFRRSTILDVATLSHLAAQDGRPTPRGVYLIAEISGRVVAATSLERQEAPLCNPAHNTADIQELLRRWSRSLQRDINRGESRAA